MLAVLLQPEKEMLTNKSKQMYYNNYFNQGLLFFLYRSDFSSIPEQNVDDVMVCRCFTFD